MQGDARSMSVAVVNGKDLLYLVWHVHLLQKFKHSMHYLKMIHPSDGSPVVIVLYMGLFQFVKRQNFNSSLLKIQLSLVHKFVKFFVLKLSVLMFFCPKSYFVFFSRNSK